MAVIRVADSNLSAKMFTFKDLGFGSNLVVGVTVGTDSDDVNCYGARTCLLLAAVTTLVGPKDLEVKASVSAGTPNFGAADLDLTCPAAAAMIGGFINTTAAKPYISLQLISANGCTVVDTKFQLQVGAKIASGAGYHESQFAMAGILSGIYSSAI